MPWLPRPAGVYTRHEVVLHRLDDPMVLSITHPGSKLPTLYEAWELRLIYVFDAGKGRWEVQSVKPFGYRRHNSNGPRIEIQGTTPELRALAQMYAPSWIPDPSKAKIHLPAEDVFDEALTMVRESLHMMPAMTQSMRVAIMEKIEKQAENPYREVTE